MGIKTSDVLDILLSVSGMKLDELCAELEGLCSPRGWALSSLTPQQLREIMHEYLAGHMALIAGSTDEPAEWTQIQAGFGTIEA